MAFTEFYCDPVSGDNLNAGSTTGAPTFTFATGGWVQATRIFTATGANLSAVNVGDFASVNADAATGATGYVARITAVDDVLDTITLSATALSGTAPADGADRTIRVGGVWKGPNAAIGFPFNFITNVLTNIASDQLRVNFKNNATYSITTAISHNVVNGRNIVFQGYTTSPGDGGKWILDGGAGTVSYLLLTMAATNAQECVLADFIIQHPAVTTGVSALLTLAANSCLIIRVVANNGRGSGFAGGGNSLLMVECEAYACNKSNNALSGGFAQTGGNRHVRCFSHDNPGNNSCGFYTGGNTSTYINCVAASNGLHGFLAAINTTSLYACDAYNNTFDGYSNSVNGGVWYIENSNFAKNGRYGINFSAVGGTAVGFIYNCGFGGGADVNVSGNTNGLRNVMIFNSINYATNPWVDPVNGNFNIMEAAAEGTGRGNFTLTAPGYGPTTGYPDVGAAPAQDAPGGSFTFVG